MTTKTPTRTPSELDAISYDLSKRATDIRDRGCTIATAYGDLVIEPGHEAHEIAAAIVRILWRRQRIALRHATAVCGGAA